MRYLNFLVSNILLACATMAYASQYGNLADGEICSIATWQGNKRAALTMTYDDGLKEHYTIVYPELRKRGLTATFYIIGTKVGRDQKGTPCCTWQELKEMADGGMEIGSHGYQHRNVETLSATELIQEVERNDSLIRHNTGHKPLTYCFPGNRKTEDATAYIKTRYLGARMFQTSIGSKRDSLWLARYLQDGIKKGEWLVGMTHGITTGYDCFSDSGRVWRKHLDDIVALQEELWVTTMADALAYQQLRDNALLSVHKTKGGMTITVSCDTTITNRHTIPLTLIVHGTFKQAKQGSRSLPMRHVDSNTVIDVTVNKEKILLIY